MNAKIVILPGDGIGPEVIKVAREVLEEIVRKFGHHFEMEEHLLGGCAMDKYNNPLPKKTLRACLSADAVLLGAVGGPKWDDPKAKIRPEQGLLGLRKGMDLFANLRPIQPHPELLSASPLKTEKLNGVEFVVVRELTGGIYFGEPRERREINGQIHALDTMEYSQSEIERVAYLAFKLAKTRRNKLTSIDKANVLETSRLWREVVTEVSKNFPDVQLEHLLVDAAAMHLLSRPESFDVILAPNLFGDILTDESSVLTGSMGNLPSASLGENKNVSGNPRGLFEPIHGSAPDIAGKGIANPIGAILSAGLLLRLSLGLEEEASVITNAVDQALDAGYRTKDIASSDHEVSSTKTIGEAIIANIKTNK